MIQFLGLLKNPFVKIIAEKTVGAITHKLEKDKIIKAKEIEAASKLDVAKVGVQRIDVGLLPSLSKHNA